MDIQKQLPHFYDENVLLVVTGSVEYKIFQAGDGKINEIAEFNSKSDMAFDEEKVESTRSGGGQVFGVGAADKSNQMHKELEGNFTHHLKAQLTRLAAGQTFDKLFLFCPPQVLASVEDIVPADLKKSLVLAVKGNYTKQHPFDLLTFIKEEPADKVKHYV